MALTDKLSAIGEAIREKTGKTELLTLDAMPTEIAAISGGGSGDFSVARVSRKSTTSFDVSNYVESGKNFVLFLTHASSSSYARYVYFSDGNILGSLATATPTATGIQYLTGNTTTISTSLALAASTPTVTLTDGILKFGSGTVGTYAILYYVG